MPRRRRPPLGPSDISGRDDQANRELAVLFADFPSDHPAYVALTAGRPTVVLTHLVDRDMGLVAAIMRIDSACRDRGPQYRGHLNYEGWNR